MALVLFTLVAASAVVFALQAEASAAMLAAHADLRLACSRWTARGGVHFTLEFMATQYRDEPSSILEQKNPPAFYSSHGKQRFGWIVAEYPHLPEEDRVGVTSEQGRMPLSNLTTAAIDVLFPDSASRAEILARRVEALPPPVSVMPPRRPGEPPRRPAMPVRPFAHLFELLGVDGVSRELLFGQDLNDNGVLDPPERLLGGAVACPPSVTSELGLEVDRGIQEVLTTNTDGRFDPFGALRSVREIFLADWPGAAAILEHYPREKPLEDVIPRNQGWRRFVWTRLARRPAYFRIPIAGTHDGKPLARVRAVIQHVGSFGGRESRYRIVDWREEG